jgi:hypothetical protein
MGRSRGISSLSSLRRPPHRRQEHRCDLKKALTIGELRQIVVIDQTGPHDFSPNDANQLYGTTLISIFVQGSNSEFAAEPMQS